MHDRGGPIVALVPVRSPGEGKTRLSVALSRDERAGLAGAMLADVASALRNSAVDRIVVAASGPAAAAAARALGLDVALDPPGAGGLDRAVAGAQARLGPVGGLLVVTADLPRLGADDVDRLIAVDAAVVVAGTDDGGTGGLLRRPARVVATAYGRGSASRHVALARRAGVSCARVELAGFRHDVDTWEDLVALRHGDTGPATSAFMRSIADRVEAAG